MTQLCHISRPCAECPWRKDAEPQKFTEERYEALRNTSDQSSLHAPLFACHMTKEGREQACAGWLAVAGEQHLGVRLAVIDKRLDPAALRPHAGWPELHEDYDALVAHQGFNTSPGDDMQKFTATVTKVKRLQNSADGNPRCRVTLDDGREFTTMRDAAAGGVPSTWDEGCVVELTIDQGEIVGYAKVES